MKKIILGFFFAGLLTFCLIPVVEATAIPYDHVPNSTILKSDTMWQVDLGGVFEVDSIFILSPETLTPHRFIFKDTIKNSSHTFSMDSEKNFDKAYSDFLEPFVFANLVTIVLQGSGSLNLSEVEINVFPSNPVPEPATVFLIFTGLACLGFISRLKTS